jgi:cell division protein FtsB|tara:strand:+ start:381 stop:593 length:213 start_codon:yes stop_codon:yes gene_type:complete
MFDKDVGVNWHLRFRLKIEELEKDNEQLKLKNKILTRKIKKYEDNNTRTTRNREDNNTVKSSRSVYTGRR